MSHIKDKVVVITGTGSGFGRLVACKAAARGACVIGVDVNEDELVSTVDMITSTGGQAIGLWADVTDPAAMSTMVQAAQAWSRCIDINFKGVLNGICAVYDQMITQGTGQIINLSSIYGNYPVRGAAVYGATKAAVSFISEALRQESQGRIKVTTIRPTGIPTTGISSDITVRASGDLYVI